MAIPLVIVLKGVKLQNEQIRKEHVGLLELIPIS